MVKGFSFDHRPNHSALIIIYRDLDYRENGIINLSTIHAFVMEWHKFIKNANNQVYLIDLFTNWQLTDDIDCFSLFTHQN